MHLIKLLNFSERLEVFVVNSNHVARLWNFVSISPSLRNGWRVALCLAAVLATSLSGAGVFAQTPARAGKLPSPEKIVGEYLKAVGGKKRVAGVRDAVYEWSVEGQQQGTTALRIQRRSPDAERRDVLDGGNMAGSAAANSRTAWVQEGTGGFLQTLTGAEASIAKLHATLAARRLVDYKKSNVLARTIALEQIAGEQSYLVEFATREGGRVRYWFGATSKLILQIADDARRVRFGDYRAEGRVLEPHRMTEERDGQRARTLMLTNVRYNTGISDDVFDPPRAAETIDVLALIREVGRNQQELDQRVSEYTFTRRQVEREINDRGEVKKEKTIVHEVYPVAGGGRVLKLISEDNVALSAEKAAREEKRVVEELAKTERENEKRQQKRAREKEERAKKKGSETGVGENGDDDVGIAAFLRASEFVSPRRERFRDRDAVVFDFRARPGFRPTNRDETLIAKLAGVVWIDPVDRQVMRLEARLAEGFKIGGGLLASVRPGSNFAFEQTRLADGVWLPRFSQISASAKVFLLAGFKLDATREYSDYKRFSAKTGDATLDAPVKP